MQLFAVMLVLCLAATLIASPLLWRRESVAGDDDLAALEAAKDAKFREIRDAEHDMRTGKLSPDDFREIDSTLRAEAVDILRGMDSARTEGTEP